MRGLVSGKPLRFCGYQTCSSSAQIRKVVVSAQDPARLAGSSGRFLLVLFKRFPKICKKNRLRIGEKYALVNNLSCVPAKFSDQFRGRNNRAGSASSSSNIGLTCNQYSAARYSISSLLLFGKQKEVVLLPSPTRPPFAHYILHLLRPVVLCVPVSISISCPCYFSSSLLYRNEQNLIPWTTNQMNNFLRG